VISEKPWSPDSVVRLLLGVFSTLFFGPVIAFLLLGNQGILGQLAVGTVFFHLGSLVWIWFFLRQFPMRWSVAFGLESFRRGKAVLWGLAGGLLFLPAALALQWVSAFFIQLATRHPPVQQQLVAALQNTALPWGQLVFMGVVTILIAPFAEETLFRGILYPAIKQNGFPRAAWWITSLVFASMHVNTLSFIPLTVFSLVLIFLYEKTGSLWASISAHCLLNSANFTLALLTAASNHPHAVR
jgi:membrane protease YdiL (CAAX protease family)